MEGYFYEHGLGGLPSNTSQSTFYYFLAGIQGHKQSQKFLIKNQLCTEQFFNSVIESIDSIQDIFVVCSMLLFSLCRELNFFLIHPNKISKESLQENSLFSFKSLVQDDEKSRLHGCSNGNCFN